MQLPAGPQTITSVLQEKGDRLTGTMLAPSAAEPTPMNGGVIDGHGAKELAT